MNTKILEEIGLTPGEIKTYIALLELGQCSAGEVIQKANIQNSVFHFCINNLIEKGLASYVKKGTARIYCAADPENILNYVKDKEHELENLLPELKKHQNKLKEKTNVEVFEGLHGIRNMLQMQIQDAKDGDEFLFLFPNLGDKKNEEIQKFYLTIYPKRFEKGVIQKGIVAKELKKFNLERKKRPVKYVDFPIPANIGLFHDKMVILSWTDKPKGILIQAKDIVDRQKEFFYELWNMK